MREAGDVMFTDVFSDCTGVVEFARHEDMKRAVRILNDTKFRSHQVGTYISFALKNKENRQLHVRKFI
jgi:arginine/serine-rich splicing factor 1/9